ncbi:alpha/beta fold hydrolase [Nocardia australiensis]|uniref:alpha/beta fold hydrolase n=1 Tax=Nocardia australiensis TaxID=2887191 RepID=UPI001D150145|nr:alpha/beta fold hydrolase [Nocardia australiensis]
MNRKKAMVTVQATIAALIVGAMVACTAPADAHSPADPNTPALDRFYHQTLDWKSCEDPRLDPAGAQCADVTVPLNYAAPQSNTITVAISRIAAADTDRRGVMLSNPGGPGGAGLDFMVDVGAAMTPDVRAGYDLIGMDPRGVGRSSPVDCHWPHGFGLQSAGIDAASFAESVASQGDLAARCTAAEGARLQYFTTRNTARDMDVIRGALGVDRVSYFGTSYGTYLGSVFTQMFPERADRIVLDSSVDPARYGPVGMIQDMGTANENALDLWADWTASRDDTYHFGTTRDAVRTTVADLIRRSAADPIRLGGFMIDDHILPLVLFTGLDDPRQYEHVAEQLRQIADAAEGKPVDISPDLHTDLVFMLDAQPRDNSAQMAVMCGDVAAPRDPAWYLRNIEATRATQPVFGSFVNNITPCAFWAPPVESPTVVHNSVPTLIVQSTGDTRTSYPGAVAMHNALSASRMVTLQDVPIHWIFGRFENHCTYDAVNTYLRDGTLPAEDITCHAD